MNAAGEKHVREDLVALQSTIFPEMVGHTIAVHDGRKHVPVYVTEDPWSATSWANSPRPARSRVTPPTRASDKKG